MPKGMLAKLIVLDQFPRSVYRGTATAYANDPVTVRLAEHLCTTTWDVTEYNIMERMWVYVPLSHARLCSTGPSFLSRQTGERSFFGHYLVVNLNAENLKSVVFKTVEHSVELVN